MRGPERGGAAAEGNVVVVLEGGAETAVENEDGGLCHFEVY